MPCVASSLMFFGVVMHWTSSITGTSGESVNLPSGSSHSLTVSRGGSVYIRPGEHFSLSPPPSMGINVTCKVKIVMDDPAALRVGSVEPPQVLDCHSKTNRLRYIHSGSPLVTNDRIPLFVIYFNSTDVVQVYHQLVVTISEQEFELFVNDSALKSSLTVPALSALSEPISHQVLRVLFKFSESVNCFIRVESTGSHFPYSGRLVTSRNESAENVSMDCQEFLMEGFRYRHNGRSSVIVDYIPLAVEVESPREDGDTDDDQETRVSRERFYLPVHILSGMENVAPSIFTAELQPIAVEQLSLLVVDGKILSAFDDESREEHLVFSVVSPVVPIENGFFTEVRDTSRVLTSFTQDDITSGRIAYHPPTNVLTADREISIDVIVVDNFLLKSKVATLKILIIATRTTSPRVLRTARLVVVEGAEQVITTKNLRIVDTDNLDDVEVTVKGGLRHGSLKVRGSTASRFTVKDLEDGFVTYRHAGGEATEDKILIKISDGKHSTRSKITVEILPLDDSSPYLSTNIPIEVKSGSYVQFDRLHLNCNDKDFRDAADDILFVLKGQPRLGEIVKRHHPLTRGQRLTHFTQLDINRGLIYYQHFGDSTGGDSDQVEFRLHDRNEPPNKSGLYTMDIKVIQQNNLSPYPMEASEGGAKANCSEILVITRQHLAYDDADDGRSSLIYTISRQPYFLHTNVSLDAGRLIVRNATNSSEYTSSTAEAVKSFAQQDVDEERIAYIPPPLTEANDLINHSIRFTYAVCDPKLSCIYDQMFEITLQAAVDDVKSVIPRPVKEPLKVLSGEAMTLTSDIFLTQAQGSSSANVVLQLDEVPKHGKLTKNEMRMTSGTEFSLNDLVTSSIRYVNDGSPAKEDTFVISKPGDDVTSKQLIKVNIEAKVTRRPQPLPNLHSRIQVDENGQVFLSTSNLAATDNDTDDRLLNFIIVKLPDLGEIHMDGKKVDKFTQGELIDAKVSYVHTGKEIGLSPAKDIITFTVFDQSLPGALETIPMMDLEVTILPVDNSPPELLVGGPLLIIDGQAASITSNIVSARDADSSDQLLTFVIAQTPMWGFLERSKLTSRSGRSQTSRRISSFTMADIREGAIQYVPSNLFKGSPPSDSFFIYATDGLNQSPLSQVEVSVLSADMKLPDFEMSGNIVVEEGGEKEIRIQITFGEGISQKKDSEFFAKLSVATPPLHGELVLLKAGKVGRPDSKEIRFHDVILNNVSNTDVIIMYRHDGSESTDDRFALSLSEGIHVVKRSCLIMIIPVNDIRPALIRAGPLYVDYGGTRLLTNSVLKAIDDDTSDSNIVFEIVAIPRKGILEFDKKGASRFGAGGNWVTLETGHNFTQADVDDNRIRYTHTIELSDTSTDSFLFRLSDGLHFLAGSSFLIEISKVSSHRLLLHNRGLSLTAGETRTINRDVLRADDGNSDAAGILFTIIDPPLYGNVSILGRENATDVKMFTQQDVNDKVVLYKHTGRKVAAEDSMTLSVSTSRLAAASPRIAVLRVTIHADDGSIPMLVTNTPVTVVQGSTVAITVSNLFASLENGYAENLTYIVLERPKHGQLLNRGFPVTWSITQGDVNAGDVTYSNDANSDAQADYFLFTITDNRHDGYLINGTIQRKPSFFHVLIQPAAKGVPRVIKNQSPMKLQSLGNRKHGFIINGDHLKVTHPLFNSNDILYTIKESPRHGMLEYRDTGRPLRRKFSQLELDDGVIAFVLNDRVPLATEDSFVFKVQDGNRNTLDDQKFQLRWSVLQFNQTQYAVCEDAEALYVKVVRLGSTEGRVTAELRTKEQSARAGLDFYLPPNTRVVFESGVSEVSVRIEIINDFLENEGNERFKVQLRNAESTLLGNNSKALIHIIDVEDGQCRDVNGLLDETLTSKQSSIVQGGHSNPFSGFNDNDDGYFKSFDDYITEDDLPNYDYTGSTKVGEDGEGDDDDDAVYADWGQSSWYDIHSPLSDPVPQSGGHLDTPMEGNRWEGNGWEDNFSWDADRQTVPTGGDFGEKAAKKRKNKKGEKAEHPLKKYKLERKLKGVFGEDRRANSNWEAKRVETDAVIQATSPPTVAPSTSTTTPGPFAPQDCTRDTEGLLYFDLLSSKMYRCNGREWEHWGWGPGGAYQYTALLKDAASTNRLAMTSLHSSGENAGEEWKEEEQRKKEKGRKRLTCLSDWSLFESNCYMLGSGKVTWNKAEEECASKYKAHLTDVISEKHLTWLWELTSQHHFWIGLNDKKSSGNWKFISAESNPAAPPSPPYLNWRRNFPRRSSKQREQRRPLNCVMASKRMEWVNRACDKHKARFICVQPAYSAASKRTDNHWMQ